MALLPTKPSRRSFAIALPVVLAFAFLLRFTVATLSPTILWPDEIFQSLEQAHRLIWGYGILPWEFRDGARSWLLPGMLAGVMRATAWMAPGSTGYLAGVRAFLSLVSLGVPAGAFVIASRRGYLRGAVVAGLATSVWFELVYFAPKALAESVAAAPLVLGIALLEGVLERSRRRDFVAGLLLASSVMMRVHLAPAVVLVVVVAVWTRGWREWGPLFLGMLPPIAFGGLLDLVTWGSLFHSYIANFVSNLAGRSQLYGTAPWYGYFAVLGRVWSWAALVLVPLAVIGGRRAPLLALAAVVTLVTHVAFAHKEYRFLVPTLALVVVLAALGLAEGCRWCETRFAWTDVGGWLAAVGALVVWGVASLDRAADYDWIATSLAGSSGEPPFMWHHFRGTLQAFEAMSRDDSICGVAVEGRYWNTTGGYVTLHHDVPLFALTSAKVFETYLDSFNVILSHEPGPETVGAYQRMECFDSSCIYKRPGLCVKPPGYDLNAEIASHGM